MVVMMITSGAMAQQRQRATPEERAKRQTETLVKELSLTQEQKDKVYEINLKYANTDVKNTGNADREKRMAEFQKLQGERIAAIKEVLTAEQQKKIDKHISDNQDKMKGNSRRQR